MLVLNLGAFWSYSTLRELTDERDKRELRVVMIVQPITALIGGGVWLLWYHFVGYPISPGGMVVLYFIGFFMIYRMNYSLLRVKGWKEGQVFHF